MYFWNSKLFSSIPFFYDFDYLSIKVLSLEPVLYTILELENL